MLSRVTVQFIAHKPRNGTINSVLKEVHIKCLSSSATKFPDIAIPIHNLLSKEAAKTISIDTANRKELLTVKINESIKKFQIHDIDTGSTSVQIAILTDKIINFAKHIAVHRKDHASNRGFQGMISRRRKLMKYLKRKNFEEFNKVVLALGLVKEAFTIN
eukprot:gene15972-21676_t